MTVLRAVELSGTGTVKRSPRKQLETSADGLQHIGKAATVRPACSSSVHVGIQTE